MFSGINKICISKMSDNNNTKGTRREMEEDC